MHPELNYAVSTIFSLPLDFPLLVGFADGTLHSKGVCASAGDSVHTSYFELCVQMFSSGYAV